MDQMMNLIAGKFEIFLLIMVRISGVFMITPIFGRRNVPAMYKIGLAFMISLILLNTVSVDGHLFMDFPRYLLVVAKELMVGFSIGFVTFLIFSSIYIAGQIIDMEIGFGVVNVLDPQSNIQVPIMGNFLYILALMVFVMIDGHHMLISALYHSFKIIPLGKVNLFGEFATDFARIFGETFVIGFKIAAPVVAAIFLTDVALGILARTMPQMNVFMVGMPLKIIVGLVTLMLMIPVLSIILDFIYNNISDNIYRILTHLR